MHLKNILFRILKPNHNLNRLEKVFDYNFYNKNGDEYRALVKELNINTLGEVDYVLELLKILPNKNKYSYLFNPVEEVLKHFNRNQEIKTEILIYYFERILPIIKVLFHQISNDHTKGIILETLVCIGSIESIEAFIEFVSDENNNIDNYDTYRSIKACIDLGEDQVNLFINNSEKLLKHNNFRTVAIVELFSQWALDGKIVYNPIQNHLHIIEKWIIDKDYKHLSYAVSGCAALAQINTEESVRLLKIASNHPKLEIQLESAFSLIILGHNKVKEKLKELARNPLIFNYAFAYAAELERIYKIECGFTYEEVIASIPNVEDFVAMASMSEWCSHEREYGITPDSITIWCKKEIPWPTSDQEKVRIYLIKYKYNNYCWEGKIQDIEHIGYYNYNTDNVFSLMEEFDDIDSAYLAYSNFERGAL